MMIGPIDWGTILKIVACLVLAAALLVSRMKPAARNQLFERLRPGHAHGRTDHGSATIHQPAVHAASDGHGHKEGAFDMDFNMSGGAKWAVVGVLGVIALGLLAAGLGFGVKSPSPGTIASAVRNAWLWCVAAYFLLFVITHVVGKSGKPFRSVVYFIGIFLLVIGIFGTAMDNMSSKHGSGRTASVKQTRPPTGEKMWVSFVAPPTGITWILAAEGHNTHICDPGVSPNCDPIDPALERYRKWCRIGTETFAWETGRCVMQDAVGVQSKTGAELPLGYTDIANDKVEGIIVPVAAPAPAENDEELALAGEFVEE
ncbi:MAG: hypothetical protein V4681_02025 [Patescibacteria group bacterium]